jgi:3-methyladenine DNA glycosylase AlkC
VRYLIHGFVEVSVNFLKEFYCCTFVEICINSLLKEVQDEGLSIMNRGEGGTATYSSATQFAISSCKMSMTSEAEI